jgi:Glycosyl transferase family 2
LKLAMTLLVRDEEDIIAANIEHHMARGVDLIVVTDNGSVDATVEILRSYEEQGALHLLHEPTDDYSQARWVTRMARLCAKEGADWVINCDADEFWWPRAASDLKQVFAQVPPEVGVVSVPRHNFPPRPEDGRPFFERMTLRDLNSLNSRGRPLPPKVAHRAHPEAKVRMGNHRVKGPGLDTQIESDEIEILHFPMRTFAQFENKIVKGGRALASNTRMSRGKVVTWRELYALWQEGGLREHYDAAVVPSDPPPTGYVEDTRVRDFLRTSTLVGPG